MSPYLVPAAFAFVLTSVLTGLALFVFPKLGLLDKPEKYGLKRKPIPYSGGILFFLVFLIGAALFLNWDKHLIGVIIAAFLLLLVNIADDFKRVNPLLRLLVQLLAGLTIIGAGIGITSITNPLGGVFVLDQYQIPIKIGETIYRITLLADLFTLIWVVAMVNVINFLDGVPGLVSGVSFIGALVLFVLSVRPDFHTIDQTQVATMAVLVLGIAFAFWFFDFPPARILMGDTGSMFFGLMLAVLAIFSGGKIATAFLIMGFPFLDALWVIFRRVLQKKSPFKGDLRHFHHRLLTIGFSQRQALLLIYLICASFGGVALFLGSKQKLIAILILLLLIAILGTVAVLKEKKKRV